MQAWILQKFILILIVHRWQGLLIGCRKEYSQLYNPRVDDKEVSSNNFKNYLELGDQELKT